MGLVFASYGTGQQEEWLHNSRSSSDNLHGIPPVSFRKSILSGTLLCCPFLNLTLDEGKFSFAQSQAPPSTEKSTRNGNTITPQSLSM